MTPTEGIFEMQFRQIAERVYCRSHEDLQGLTYIVRNLQEITRHPEWLRQRTGATMALRLPWWPYNAISWVSAALPLGARVFEYGAEGRRCGWPTGARLSPSPSTTARGTGNSRIPCRLR
jgi:hypothetical protein